MEVEGGSRAEHQRAQAEEGLEESGTLGPSKPPSVQESSEQMAKHLNGLFAPLIFPSDLAHRVLTHGSHVSAKYGSNGALGFTGMSPALTLVRVDSNLTT